MLRRVAVACILTIIVSSLGIAFRPSRAEASCRNSSIMILPVGNRILSTLQVAWFIRPACDVIATGVLMGASADTLQPVGEVFYRYEEMYLVNVPVSSGRHWVAAYTRDEDGQMMRSPVLPVDVFVPDPPAFVPSGSQGALAYTGTDTDFLQPAGNPHFASLRLDSLVANSTFSAGGMLTGVGVFRDFSSPHVSEVWAELGPGFPAEFISQGIAAWNAFFASQGYPRTGLYHFTCFGFRQLPASQTSGSCQWQGSPYAVYEETIEDIVFNSTGLSSRFTTSTRSTLKYFVPTVPSGERVASALLTLVTSVYGDYRAIRLNSKPPVTTQPLTSCPTLGSCTLIATWDFTSEVRALAERGGGELQLQLDPIPQFLVVVPFPDFNITLYINSASWAVFPAVNYPWAHGGALGALTITFEEACPQQLTLMGPGSIMPQLPGLLQPQAPVQAVVQSCPPGSVPAAVEVRFAIQAPAPGTPEAGGHAHDGGRPRGQFVEAVDKTRPQEASCTVTLDAQGRGSCTVTYQSPEVSGVETIAATAPGLANAQAKVLVRIAQLMSMPQSAQGKWRLTGGFPSHPSHPDNHYGTGETVQRVVGIATAYFKLRGESLGINDLSLIWGGLFDIGDNWNPPHSLHRVGHSVDIDQCTNRALVRQDVLDEVAERDYGAVRVAEGSVLPPCGGPANTPLIHYELP